MPGGSSITVEPYLQTSFEYDAECADGKAAYRAWPDRSHSEVQRFLSFSFYEKGRLLGFTSRLSQKIRTQSDPPRYRVPDVRVTLGEPDEEIFTTPPFLCV